MARRGETKSGGDDQRIQTALCLAMPRCEEKLGGAAASQTWHRALNLNHLFWLAERSRTILGRARRKSDQCADARPLRSGYGSTAALSLWAELGRSTSEAAQNDAQTGVEHAHR